MSCITKISNKIAAAGPQLKKEFQLVPRGGAAFHAGMEVKYNCEQLGCFKVSFKSFRKVAVKLNIKYWYPRDRWIRRPAGGGGAEVCLVKKVLLTHTRPESPHHPARK